MANKPLQSIKFPGLPDKYTVPQMDSNFDGVSGKIPDSKKVHDEIDSLKEDLTFSTGNTEIAFTKGAYIKTNTTPIDISSPVTDSAFKYAVIDCSAGDVFTLTAQGAGSARAFAFLNSTNTPLWMSASGYIANNLIIVAPIGATHLVINDRVANNTRSYYGAAIKDAVVYEDGEEQIKTPNIEGMVKTNNTVLSNNLFSKATLLRSGYYVGISSGQISFTSNASYDTYIMPVDGSTYNFTNVRFGVKLRADQTIAVGETITNATSVDTSGAEYFAWSFNPTTYPTSAFEVKKRMNTYKIPVDWDLSANVEEKTPYGKASGTLANGEYIEISGRSALKDGEKIIFKGVLSSFSSLRLGFMYAGGVSNYIDVDATNITIKNSTDAATINAHGLTIVNDITIIVEFIRGDAKISVISNGNIYTTTVAWVQISAVASSPRITSTNTVCTYAELRTVYDAISRDVWYFGDSYISFNNAQRWVYYLKEYGFDTNILLSGSAGCSSAITRTAIETLLKYGTPKIAVMATGMNDGSDNGDTPASTWVSNRDYFLSNCQTADAEPIFCTIPTTPTVNNEAKNAWVKNSGYQYIDFAKAVGAQADGTWYSGMLASDNVHPTELGARALFSQVLIDLPEVMLT